MANMTLEQQGWSATEVSIIEKLKGYGLAEIDTVTSYAIKTKGEFHQERSIPLGESEFERLAGMMAKIAYEVHDKDGIDQSLSEMLLDLWREFNHYTTE